ncbi:unnamed protein product [Fusarium venenatum]|uniref:Uncharacterized protein n=1 Tax=Fusarium venenatum TaxID=56646 RepID=A0A2L2T2T5_9HYPO|nr:uncharacterized protein FVRRES_12190 [Fusarium venenatum]KAH6978824.1 hypothetical protein EDB82DRAFT_477556 [Fusarium venenatum]CEI39499.1 unnamed protein product [Fusarium venenatum]
MNSLSPGLSRVAQSVTRSITIPQSSRILYQTRASCASHSILQGLGRAPTQHSLLPPIYQRQIRTKHTTGWTRQSMQYNLDREIQKKISEYMSLERESHQIINYPDEANLRVLCYGLVFFSVIGIIGRLLGLLSDDSDSESSKKEDIPLPGFLGKSVLEATDAVTKNLAKEKEIRGARRYRVARSKTSKPSPKRSAAKVTSLSRDSRSWVPELETLMFFYPGVL